MKDTLTRPCSFKEGGGETMFSVITCLGSKISGLIAPAWSYSVIFHFLAEQSVLTPRHTITQAKTRLAHAFCFEMYQLK